MHWPCGMDVRDAPAARIEHLDLPDELTGAQRQCSSRSVDLHHALDDEQELGTGLADPHDRLAVRVLTLLAECEDGSSSQAAASRTHADRGRFRS